MKKILITLTVILSVFAIAFTVLYRNYKRFYGDKTYYTISSETTTFNEIFYNYVKPSKISYVSYDGEGSKPAGELAKVLSRSNYIPLNKKEGLKIILKESKETFVVTIFNDELLYSQEKPTYFIYNARCIIVNGKLYLIVLGDVKEEILNPKDVKNTAASELRYVISVYKCADTQEIYDELINYKKVITDYYYIPYYLIGVNSLKYSIFHVSTWRLKSIVIVAIPILAGVVLLAFAVIKQKSNAKKYVEANADDKSAGDSDLPEDKNQT